MKHVVYPTRIFQEYPNGLTFNWIFSGSVLYHLIVYFLFQTKARDKILADNKLEFLVSILMSQVFAASSFGKKDSLFHTWDNVYLGLDRLMPVAFSIYNYYWRLSWSLERFRITFTANDKREFVPRGQHEVFPLLVFNCSLLLHKNM